MLRLKPSAKTENIKSIINVEVNDPVLVTKEPASVATNDEGIRNVLAILKLSAKFLEP